jgi:putative solute:sodium symporter small subunit
LEDRYVIEQRYWRRTKRLTGALLTVWLLATLVGPWFARDLEDLRFAGFPLSFWVASQGALLLYIAIIVVYALVTERLDSRYLREREDPGSFADE